MDPCSDDENGFHHDTNGFLFERDDTSNNIIRQSSDVMSASDSSSDSENNTSDLKKRSKISNLEIMEDGDDDDDEIDGNIDDIEIMPDLDGGDRDENNPLRVIRLFFTKRLEEFFVEHNAYEEIMRGWNVRVFCKCTGIAAGLIDVYYTHKSKVYRSRVEAAISIGIIPYARTIKAMPRFLHYLLAVESREKHLISQQLLYYDGVLDDIRQQGDDVTFLPVVHVKKPVYEPPQPQQLSSPSPLQAVTLHASPLHRPHWLEDKEREGVGLAMGVGVRKDDVSGLPYEIAVPYFTYGNCTVLSWGTIRTTGPFHNRNQFFPVGFRCIRQEHDILLDRVVDCLCEIISFSVPKMEDSKNNSSVDYAMPLFRLTVAWELDDDTQVIRVYEGKSPQLAWQSAMLERVGVPKDIDEIDSLDSLQDLTATALLARSASGAQDALSSLKEIHVLEDEDDEERHLRNLVMEKRRSYFRALSYGQANGRIMTVKPRLSVDKMDTFIDDGLLRIIEGMRGANECQNYQFMDSRSYATGRKCMLKGLTAMLLKVKQLDRVISTSEQGRPKHALTKRRLVFGGLLRTPKDFALSLQQRFRGGVGPYQNRRMKTKELEKGLKLLKEELVRVMSGRKMETKLKIDHKCATIEDGITMASEQCTYGIGMTTLSVEELSGVKEKRKVMEVHQCDVMRCEAKLFGRIMELWTFLVTFRDILKLSTIPSYETILTSLTYFNVLETNLSNEVKLVQSLVGYTTPSSHSKDNQAVGTVLLADSLLSKVAMCLLSPLMPDFYHFMNIEVSAEGLVFGDCKIIVNELTYMEVIKTIIMGTYCKEMGMSDLDTGGALKGKGFTNAPDAQDRRCLKLIRRRILNRFLRSESQSANSNASGAHAINANKIQHGVPAFPSFAKRLSSGGFVASPGESNTNVIEKAWFELFSFMDTKSAWHSADCSTVVSALALSDFGVRNISHNLLVLLRQYIRVYSVRTSNMDAVKDTDNGEHYIPSQAILELCRVSAGVLSTLLECTFESSSQHEYYKFLYSTTYDTLKRLVQFCSARNHIVTVFSQKAFKYDTPTLSNKATCTSSAISLYRKYIAEMEASLKERKQRSNVLEDMDEEEEDAMSVDENVSAQDNGVKTAEASVNGVNAVDMEDGKRVTSVLLLSIYGVDEAALTKELSEAMKRCLEVLKYTMLNPLADLFNHPVDDVYVPGYYEYVKQPLCFYDIRHHLLHGKYEDSVYLFYKDVLILFLNALAFNSEMSAVSQSTHKMMNVFDRLFTEMVLDVYHPLQKPDDCHICRSAYDAEGDISIICDRCDGCFHLSCLNPDLKEPPGGEWFCPACIKENHLDSLHYLRNAIVKRPSIGDETSTPALPSPLGRVVGIRSVSDYDMSDEDSVDHQLDRKKAMYFHSRQALESQNLCIRDEGFCFHNQNELLFQVVFDLPSDLGTALEHVSTGSDAITQAVHVFTTDEILRYSVGCKYMSSFQKQHILSLDEKLAQANGESLFPLPSGYTRSDYDLACGVCKGYAAWGSAFTSLVPPTIHPSLLIKSQSVIEANPRALSFINVLSCMNQAMSANNPLNCTDWLLLLSNLSQRCLTVNTFIEKAISIDEQTVDNYGKTIQSIMHGQEMSLQDISSVLVVSDFALLKNDEENEEEYEDVASVQAGVKKAGAGGRKTKPKATDVSAKGKEKAKLHVDEQRVEDEGGDSDIMDSDLEEAAAKVLENGKREEKRNGAEVFEGGGERSTQEKDLYEELFDSDCEEADEGKGKGSGGGESHSATSASNQVNSAVSSSVTSAVDDHAWLTQIFSRRRGREDAIFTASLIKSVDAFLDPSEKLLTDEAEVPLEGEALEGHTDGAVVGVNGHNAALNKSDALLCIMKICVPKPSESIDMAQWLSAWNAKVDFIQQKNRCSVPGVEAEEKCAICGYTEEQLGSQFVWGRNWDEWDDDSSVDVKPDISKKKINVWLPVNDFDAEIVLAEETLSKSDEKTRLAANRKLLCLSEANNRDVLVPPDNIDMHVSRGRSVMHECCAEFLSTRKNSNGRKPVENEPRREADILVGLKHGKTMPVGYDVLGNEYWAFPGSLYLYRCCYATKTNEGDVTSEDVQIDSAFKLTDALTKIPSEWHVFRSDEQIQNVIVSLCDEVQCEKILRTILTTLFPKQSQKNQDSVEVAAAGEALAERKGYTNIASLMNGASYTRYQELQSLSDVELENLLQHPVIVPVNQDTCQLQDTAESKEDFSVQTPIDMSSGINSLQCGVAVGLGVAVRAAGDEDEIRDTDDEVDVEEEEGEGEEEMEVDEEEGGQDEVLSEVKVKRKRTSNAKFLADSYLVSKRRKRRSTFGTVDTAESNMTFRAGMNVAVDCEGDGSLWEGVIVSDRLENDSNYGQQLYRVRFTGLAGDGRSNDVWVEGNRIRMREVASKRAINSAISKGSKVSIPHHMEQLQAVRYMYHNDRFFNQANASLTVTSVVKSSLLAPPLRSDPAEDATLTLGLVKYMTLMIFAAIPIGAVDDQSEERWNDFLTSDNDVQTWNYYSSHSNGNSFDRRNISFADAWRNSVLLACNATELMESIVCLEYGIKTSWLRPSGSKLMVACFSSRLHALRNATLSLCAFRLYILDQAIRYDKVKLPTQYRDSKGATARDGEDNAGSGDGDEDEDGDGYGYGYGYGTSQGASATGGGGKRRAASGSGGGGKAKKGKSAARGGKRR